MTLAGESLQSLLFLPLDIDTPAHNFEAMAALSNLTKLVLSNVDAIDDTDNPEDVTPLHRLALLELHLSNCTGLAEALIVPGAFPFLERLYLRYTQPYFHPLCEQSISLDTITIQEHRQNVFALPSLVHISGKGELFVMGGPEGWKKVALCDPHPYSEFKERDCQLWEKVM